MNYIQDILWAGPVIIAVLAAGRIADAIGAWRQR